MPLEPAAGSGPAIGIDELADALDARFDPRDGDCFASFAPLLARLARDKGFLADLAVAELKDRFAVQSRVSGYGAQAFLLRPATGRYVLRANFWPARCDSVVRTSGTAAFLYDMAHDHNFSFLTVGYLGPGYWSDYFEYDADGVAGLPGEDAGLRFVERSRLSEGRVLLYRAHRDVHVQLPPDAFSVSLNILGAVPEQRWRSQFRFDVATGTIAGALTTAPSEALVALAAHLGGGEGRQLAGDLARRHPVPRMRVTALAALGSTLDDRECAALFEAVAGDVDPLVAGSARRWLADRSAPDASHPRRAA